MKHNHLSSLDLSDNLNYLQISRLTASRQINTNQSSQSIDSAVKHYDTKEDETVIATQTEHQQESQKTRHRLGQIQRKTLSRKQKPLLLERINQNEFHKTSYLIQAIQEQNQLFYESQYVWRQKNEEKGGKIQIEKQLMNQARMDRTFKNQQLKNLKKRIINHTKMPLLTLNDQQQCVDPIALGSATTKKYQFDKTACSIEINDSQDEQKQNAIPFKIQITDSRNDAVIQNKNNFFIQDQVSGKMTNYIDLHKSMVMRQQQCNNSFMSKNKEQEVNKVGYSLFQEMSHQYAKSRKQCQSEGYESAADIESFSKRIKDSDIKLLLVKISDQVQRQDSQLLQEISILKPLHFKKLQLELDVLKEAKHQQGTSQDRDNIQAIVQQVSFMIQEILSNLNVSDDMKVESLQKILFIAMNDLIRNLSTDCVEKANLLKFIWNQHADILQKYIDKIKEDNQNVQNLAIKRKKNYKMKTLIMTENSNKITEDLQQQIKMLNAQLAQSTKTQTQMQNKYHDLFGEHLEQSIALYEAQIQTNEITLENIQNQLTFQQDLTLEERQNLKKIFEKCVLNKKYLEQKRQKVKKKLHKFQQQFNVSENKKHSNPKIILISPRILNEIRQSKLLPNNKQEQIQVQADEISIQSLPVIQSIVPIEDIGNDQIVQIADDASLSQKYESEPKGNQQLRLDSQQSISQSHQSIVNLPSEAMLGKGNDLKLLNQFVQHVETDTLDLILLIDQENQVETDLKQYYMNDRQIQISAESQETETMTDDLQNYYKVLKQQIDKNEKIIQTIQLAGIDTTYIRSNILEMNICPTLNELISSLSLEQQGNMNHPLQIIEQFEQQKADFAQKLIENLEDIFNHFKLKDQMERIFIQKFSKQVQGEVDQLCGNFNSFKQKYLDLDKQQKANLIKYRLQCAYQELSNEEVEDVKQQLLTALENVNDNNVKVPTPRALLNIKNLDKVQKGKQLRTQEKLFKTITINNQTTGYISHKEAYKNASDQEYEKMNEIEIENEEKDDWSQSQAAGSDEEQINLIKSDKEYQQENQSLQSPQHTRLDNQRQVKATSVLIQKQKEIVKSDLTLLEKQQNESEFNVLKAKEKEKQLKQQKKLEMKMKMMKENPYRRAKIPYHETLNKDMPKNRQDIFQIFDKDLISKLTKNMLHSIEKRPIIFTFKFYQKVKQFVIPQVKMKLASVLRIISQITSNMIRKFHKNEIISQSLSEYMYDFFFNFYKSKRFIAERKLWQVLQTLKFYEKIPRISVILNMLGLKDTVQDQLIYPGHQEFEFYIKCLIAFDDKQNVIKNTVGLHIANSKFENILVPLQKALEFSRNFYNSHRNIILHVMRLDQLQDFFKQQKVFEADNRIFPKIDLDLVCNKLIDLRFQYYDCLKNIVSVFDVQKKELMSVQEFNILLRNIEKKKYSKDLAVTLFRKYHDHINQDTDVKYMSYRAFAYMCEIQNIFTIEHIDNFTDISNKKEYPITCIEDLDLQWSYHMDTIKLKLLKTKKQNKLYTTLSDEIDAFVQKIQIKKSKSTLQIIEATTETQEIWQNQAKLAWLRFRILDEESNSLIVEQIINQGYLPEQLVIINNVFEQNYMLKS